MLEEDRALAEVMLVQSDGLIGAAQELGQEPFPILDGSAPQVVAVASRTMKGHETPTQGEIRIGGASVAGETPLRRGTAMMFQAYALFPHLSVLDNVAFSLKMRGLDRAERQKEARELLSKVRLDHFADRLPAQLSGGQQQRVALARALITNPRLTALC